MSTLHKKRHIHILFLICVVVLLGSIYPAYRFAQEYKVRKETPLQIRNSTTLSDLRNTNEAYAMVKDGEASLLSLSEEKVSTEGASASFGEMRKAFSSGKYAEVRRLREELEQKILEARVADAEHQFSLYEKLSLLQDKRTSYQKLGVNISTISAGIASGSALLKDKSYTDGDTLLSFVDKELDILLSQKKEADRIAAEKAKLAVAAAAPVAVAPVSNGGVTYERKTIQTAIGSFSVDVLTVDMNRVKVKTFTANENDCAADCPLKPLASYVGENGGIAGINGTYFCPADYAQCSGVKNSFNTLVFDYKSKHYLNSAQNQYSVNPLISFYNDGAHFYTQALGYGRDTSANGVISNFPTLVHNGGVATQVNLDAKSSGKGVRGGIGFNGKTLWAVVTRNATVPESGYVFTALGAQYALNLDGGGSTALYFGGYKVGPGRALPNAVVFTN